MTNIIDFTAEKIRRVRADDKAAGTLVWPYEPEERVTPIELALNSFMALTIPDRVSLWEWFVRNRVTEAEPDASIEEQPNN
jgi:hypothetical protein